MDTKTIENGEPIVVPREMAKNAGIGINTPCNCYSAEGVLLLIKTGEPPEQFEQENSCLDCSTKTDEGGGDDDS